jgi:hypothetical protein
MQIELITGKISYSMTGAVISEDITRAELKEGWVKVKLLKAASVKIENDLRSVSIKKFGEDETAKMEGEIITELGFTMATLSDVSEKDHSNDLPSTDAFVKGFDKLRPRWEWAIKQGNMDYLRTVHRALESAVEIHNRIGRFLHVNRDS